MAKKKKASSKAWTFPSVHGFLQISDICARRWNSADHGSRHQLRILPGASVALGTGCRERPTPEPAACSKMCFEIYSKKLLESASHRETGPRKRVQPKLQYGVSWSWLHFAGGRRKMLSHSADCCASLTFRIVSSVTFSSVLALV